MGCMISALALVVTHFPSQHKSGFALHLLYSLQSHSMTNVLPLNLGILFLFIFSLLCTLTKIDNQDLKLHKVLIKNCFCVAMQSHMVPFHFD